MITRKIIVVVEVVVRVARGGVVARRTLLPVVFLETRQANKGRCTDTLYMHQKHYISIVAT